MFPTIEFFFLYVGGLGTLRGLKTFTKAYSVELQNC